MILLRQSGGILLKPTGNTRRKTANQQIIELQREHILLACPLPGVETHTLGHSSDIQSDQLVSCSGDEPPRSSLIGQDRSAPIQNLQSPFLSLFLLENTNGHGAAEVTLSFSPLTHRDLFPGGTRAC